MLVNEHMSDFFSDQGRSYVRKYYYIIELFGHCIATWYEMSRSLVKLTEAETS